MVTDHADYWAWMEEHFARWCRPAGGAPFVREAFVPDLPERDANAAGTPDDGVGDELVGTNFERKYRLEGRTFHAAILRLAQP